MGYFYHPSQFSRMWMGFVKRHAKTFERLLKFFEGLGQYDIHHTILNTCDYGVPQNRKRLYIVLIKKRLHRLPFQWPTPVTCPPLSKFWDRKARTIVKSATIDRALLTNKTSGAALEKAYQEIHDLYGAPQHVDAVIDIGASDQFSTWRVGASPTLCAQRCASLGYFSTMLQRRLSITELMRLQGCDPSDIDTRGIPRTRLGHIIGNAMSVNVVKLVLEQALKAIAWQGPSDA